MERPAEGRAPSGGPRVALVSMPFATINSPSLRAGPVEVGAGRRAGFACDVLYLNILFAHMVGWASYPAASSAPPRSSPGNRCSRARSSAIGSPPTLRTWAPRFPGGRRGPAGGARVRHLAAHVPAFLAACLHRIPWEFYDIVGFSSIFEQNLASLRHGAVC